MRTLGIFAVAVGLVGISAVACSSGDDQPAKLEADVCSKAKSSNSDNSSCPSKSSPTEPTPDPSPVPAPPPPLPARDAGPDGAVPPPSPGSTYCKDLNSCCGKITSTVEKFACIGVAVAGKETPCQVELALCLGGGVVGGNACADLNTCCAQMDSDGYPSDAQDCRVHANTNDTNTCKSWLSSYKNAAWCN